MKTKVISIISITALIFSVCAMSITSVSAVEPVNPENWTSESIAGDQDFSLAFVGDIQSLTAIDYNTSIDDDTSNNTAYVDTLFSWIAENAEAQKIKHVFTLGDLTEYSSSDDPDLSYQSPNTVYSEDKEWVIVKNAISKLDGIVPYSVIRGNHDDYQIDTFFNHDGYTTNFDGFFKEESGRYQNSIINSYKLVTLGDTKFIFITLDFNPTRAVVSWMDELLTTYSDYKAVITMHSYVGLTDGKAVLTSITGIQSTIVAGKYNGAAGTWIWDNCLKKHSNVFMTVSGHVGVSSPITLVNEGDNGNQVLNVLVDPQSYDKEVEPSGMVFLMHFYDGGKTIRTEYYSTILDGYKIPTDSANGANLNLWTYNNDNTWTLGVYEPKDPVTEAETTTEAPATTAATEAETTAATEDKKNGCKSSVSLVAIALLPAFATFSAVSLKKNKEND